MRQTKGRGENKNRGELQVTMRNTNEMMAGSHPSTRPGPTLFNLVKSAPKIKAIFSSELTEEGIRQPIPPKKEVAVELNEGIWGCAALC